MAKRNFTRQSISISPKIWDDLKLIAEMNGQTTSEYIRAIIYVHINKGAKGMKICKCCGTSWPFESFKGGKVQETLKHGNFLMIDCTCGNTLAAAEKVVNKEKSCNSNS